MGVHPLLLGLVAFVSISIDALYGGLFAYSIWLILKGEFTRTHFLIAVVIGAISKGLTSCMVVLAAANEQTTQMATKLPSP